MKVILDFLVEVVQKLFVSPKSALKPAAASKSEYKECATSITHIYDFIIVSSLAARKQIA